MLPDRDFPGFLVLTVNPPYKEKGEKSLTLDEAIQRATRTTLTESSRSTLSLGEKRYVFRPVLEFILMSYEIGGNGRNRAEIWLPD